MARQSPGKVTLGMMKGKSITTSVPVIRYHASDDELEELYPSTDDEKPASEKTTPNSSPFKTAKFKSDSNSESNEDILDIRSSSLDFSEGTPPSDPWKMLADIRGKITKTFEEKLSEIKSEKKDKLKRRSRENSSVSDTEDLGDITPTEDPVFDKPEKESSPCLKRRSHSSRFRFSSIKTGLKTNNMEDSVESGVEAAEVEEVETMTFSETSNEQSTEVSTTKAINMIRQLMCTAKPQTESVKKPKLIFNELKTSIIHCAVLLPLILLTFYMIPLPQYIMGLLAGILIAVSVERTLSRIVKVLKMPIVETPQVDSSISVLEIQAVKEHAVVEKFEGWLNELPRDYDPQNYHVARTNAVYFKLEGETLRIMETRTRVPKRAVWNETQLTARYTRKRVYSLVGASIELLPEGLTRRRRWSKKYPICITFAPEGIGDSVVIETPSDDELQESEKESHKIIVEEDETDDDVSLSKDLKEVFEDCQDEEDDTTFKVFVFGRTDRQKEDWYRRLVSAAKAVDKRNSIPSTKELTISSSSSSLSQSNGDGKNLTLSNIDTPPELTYNSYMSKYTDIQSIPTDSNITPADNDILWLNALFGRLLFDMHKCPDMINVIQDKIQRKLSNIKLPYFMESLMISELVIGQSAPFIHKASKPTVDQRGLWIDLDISYDCGVTMTVETKINLMKLTKAGSVSNNSNDSGISDKPQPARSPMFDSDVEDSPETSTEDEESIHMPATSSRESTPTQSSSRKFLSMVDKLAANKYFQHAAELSYVRRAMEGVSNTEIRLMVSVSSIEGCLSINIPPPPSDRLWYGFKPIPKINLDARPAVGERAVNIGYVTNWIKTKLLKEFDKVVVLPNMDDLVIPLCPNFPNLR
ncbi:testis-expressed sequence 2 protein [Fopius arisanus]|uniref:Testis-expressed sequence 2 protein n=1 Tax=Fopius arisanus TaxID=64838 RepID=A0A0C9Q1P8_9HYME|nr:PREDICTED: testis-expressed sequence 2 protein [Fopius arisanus]